MANFLHKREGTMDTCFFFQFWNHFMETFQTPRRPGIALTLHYHILRRTQKEIVHICLLSSSFKIQDCTHTLAFVII